MAGLAPMSSALISAGIASASISAAIYCPRNCSSGMLAAISSLSNVGYGIDSNTFTMGVSGLNIISKAVLCFDMFLGRLEIFPMLVLFAPETWRK